MTKIICDKCKKEITDVTLIDDVFFPNYICIDFRMNGSNERLDHGEVCRECFEKIENFITDYEITKADEYKKGYDDGYADGKEDAWQDQMGDDL